MDPRDAAGFMTGARLTARCARALAAGLLLATAGCVDRLPDQDRRITVTPPAFKLSAEYLWKEYKANQADADRKYWGKALAVTGVVTRLGDEGAARIVFEQESPLGVEANLLDDQAKDILAEAKPGERLTLKCYCSGLSTNVVLKSCVRP